MASSGQLAVAQARKGRRPMHVSTMLKKEKEGTLYKYTKAAEVDPDRVTLHSFGKAFATGLFRAGGDPRTVQELLGHATLEMTIRLYTEVFATTRR